jgi:hypothetical protein
LGQRDDGKSKEREKSFHTLKESMNAPSCAYMPLRAYVAPHISVRLLYGFKPSYDQRRREIRNNGVIDLEHMPAETSDLTEYVRRSLLEAGEMMEIVERAREVSRRATLRASQMQQLQRNDRGGGAQERSAGRRPERRRNGK